ncbi:MAG: hypothetical protein J2P37_19385 [Ktedonobacteraceae bacterium]|nr:hypothetical protein [Ktedonobacteraceae bacterium]
MLLAGSVLGMITWIAVLSQHAKAQRWGWFTLTFFSAALCCSSICSPIPKRLEGGRFLILG